MRSYRVRKVQLNVKEGAAETWVSAFVEDTGALAIHLNHMGEIIVTHVASGKKFPRAKWKDFLAADRFVEALLALKGVDWAGRTVGLTLNNQRLIAEALQKSHELDYDPYAGRDVSMSKLPLSDNLPDVRG